MKLLFPSILEWRGEVVSRLNKEKVGCTESAAISERMFIANLGLRDPVPNS